MSLWLSDHLVGGRRERPVIRQTGHLSTRLLRDVWPVNVALEPDRVVLLDWDVPGRALPALEVAWWIAGAAGNVPVTREQILHDVRALYPRWNDVDFGFNKALDAGLVG